MTKKTAASIPLEGESYYWWSGGEFRAHRVSIQVTTKNGVVLDVLAPHYVATAWGECTDTPPMVRTKYGLFQISRETYYYILSRAVRLIVEISYESSDMMSPETYRFDIPTDLIPYYVGDKYLYEEVRSARHRRPKLRRRGDR